MFEIFLTVLGGGGEGGGEASLILTIQAKQAAGFLLIISLRERERDGAPSVTEHCWTRYNPKNVESWTPANQM